MYLLVYPENMARNMRITKGLYFSQTILLTLTARGMERKAAYDPERLLRPEQIDEGLRHRRDCLAQVSSVGHGRIPQAAELARVTREQ